MKSLALTFAALSLVAGSAFASVEIDPGKVDVTPESRVGDATGTQITGKADVGNTGVRSNISAPAAATSGNIITNSINSYATAKAKGTETVSCDGSPFAALNNQERATVTDAVKAELAGDRCAKKFDAPTIHTIAAIDSGLLAGMKPTGASSANDPKLSTKQLAGFVISAAKRLKDVLKLDRVSQAVSKLGQTCANSCDVLGARLCSMDVMQEAEAEAATL
jgi:hypothetical protein